MKNNHLTSLLVHQITRTKFPLGAPKTRRYYHSKWRDSLTKELDSMDDHIPEETTSFCIYKVPETMRSVRPKAFKPTIISIGPYHHGLPNLQSMENLKKQVFHRLFHRNQEALIAAMDAMEELGIEAQKCYSDYNKHEMDNDEFNKMMLIDGCFLVELLRELEKSGFKTGSSTGSIIKRWMLPSLRRDLIKLENQLPMFVLNRLFDLTGSISSFSTDCYSNLSLQELAIRFFNPLLHGASNSCTEGTKIHGEEYSVAVAGGKHFLDLFRNSLLPGGGLSEDVIRRGKQMHMIRSISELREAGVKIKTDENRRTLEVTWGRSSMTTWPVGKTLTFRPLFIDDRRGTLFRNLVAYEKCHTECKPDVTTYLFFFDGLINSPKDVEILHHYEALHHSLGSNREVARLVNNICKEVGRDSEESYLYIQVTEANEYYRSLYAQMRAGLVRHYLSSWAVGISTLAAIFALYLTLIQTVSGIADTMSHLENIEFSYLLKETIRLPLSGKLRPYEISPHNTATGKDSEIIAREISSAFMYWCP